MSTTPEHAAALRVRAPRAHERATAVLGTGAAVASWSAILVALNLTGDPLICAAAYLGLAVLAVRSGHRRLLVLSVLVGLGMLVVVPGVARVDGSFEFLYDSGAWHLPSGPWGWAAALAGCLRIPAQVVAAVMLVLVPSERLLASTARWSPRAALLGGLAARMHPLLARDARLVRDDLASRGLRVGRGVAIGERLQATAAIWSALVSGMLDRAFSTAAALETRGYGSAPVTAAPLRDPRLATGRHPDPVLDRVLLAVSAALVLVVLGGRASGALTPPSPQVLAASVPEIGPLIVVAALLAAGIGLLPARTRTVAPGVLVPPATPGRSGEERSGVPGLEDEVRLTIDGVSMTYPGAVAASVVVDHLALRAGELIVLAGRSGSGKSTLLDVVSGVAPAATGGRRTGVVRLSSCVRTGAAGRVAAVFQDPEAQVLVGQVAEEVAFGLRHSGMEIQQIEQRVVAVLEELGVLHLAHRDCSTLSGGELQRVLLAAAVALQPNVLVLDEPTSQIDALSERRFWDAVDRVRRTRGVAVLAAEHRLDHVAHRCDRVIVFDRGRIVCETVPARVREDAPILLAHPYDGLVPNPVDPGSPARLSVRIDRLDVGDDHERRSVLRGLTVGIPGRGIVTLEGPNGTGKSTLLRAIRGLHPHDGQVLVDGRARGDLGASTRSIGYLAQHAGALIAGRTVLEAATESCRRLGVDPAAAHAALVAAGLDDRATAHPSELSVGERQRLALVAATAHRPTVWLLDEPTRGMDAHARRWVACHLLAHAAAGGVVMVATHDPALAAAIATHRLRLDARTGPSLVAVLRDAGGHPVEAAMDTARSEVRP